MSKLVRWAGVGGLLGCVLFSGCAPQESETVVVEEPATTAPPPVVVDQAPPVVVDQAPPVVVGGDAPDVNVTTPAPDVNVTPPPAPGAKPRSSTQPRAVACPRGCS